MNYLAAVNRVSELIKTNKLDSKLRNEDYCKANFGAHATQVIMDAVDVQKDNNISKQITIDSSS